MIIDWGTPGKSRRGIFPQTGLQPFRQTNTKLPTGEAAPTRAGWLTEKRIAKRERAGAPPPGISGPASVNRKPPAGTASRGTPLRTSVGFADHHRPLPTRRGRKPVIGDAGRERSLHFRSAPLSPAAGLPPPCVVTRSSCPPASACLTGPAAVRFAPGQIDQQIFTARLYEAQACQGLPASPPARPAARRCWRSADEISRWRCRDMRTNSPR